MGKVIAICTSKHKGTLKNEVSEANFIEEFGIEGDAHAGKWHRQVSLLALEKIEDFRNKGGNVDFGAFGENLVIEGFELNKLPVGQRPLRRDFLQILLLLLRTRYCFHFDKFRLQSRPSHPRLTQMHNE